MYKKGDNIEIISFKHDGSIHRIWDTGILIYSDRKMHVVANNKTQVLESSGKIWFTKEPAICIFMKNTWYNVIAMLKEDGIHYYSNLASPYLIDDEGIKYIDYDLDIKLNPKNSIKILDKREFKINSDSYDYSEKLVKVLKNEFNELVKQAEMRKFPFDDEQILEYFKVYKEYDPSIENISECGL